MADLGSAQLTDIEKDELTPDSPVSLEDSPDEEEKVHDIPGSNANAQSMLVDWDGPDDPEFPQNL